MGSPLGAPAWLHSGGQRLAPRLLGGGAWLAHSWWSSGVSLPPGGKSGVMQGGATPRARGWGSGLELFPGIQSWRDLGCFSPSLSNSPQAPSQDKSYLCPPEGRAWETGERGLAPRIPVCEGGRGLGEDGEGGEGCLSELGRGLPEWPPFPNAENTGWEGSFWISAPPSFPIFPCPCLHPWAQCWVGLLRTLMKPRSIFTAAQGRPSASWKVVQGRNPPAQCFSNLSVAHKRPGDLGELQKRIQQIPGEPEILPTGRGRG